MTQSKNCTSADYTAQESSNATTQSPQKTKTTILQSIVIGSVSGATEVLVDHPLWSIKTRLQQGEPFTLNPRLLYRGIIPNATSMIPITAMQVGLNQMIMNVFFKNSSELTVTQKVSCAFFAGMGSAFASCPTEMIMTHQGIRGGSFYSAGTYLMKQGGIANLYSGLFSTMMREGMFTAFYLAVTPIMKAQILNYCPNDYLASLAAGMSAGLGATVMSQSVDTIKTKQQTDPISFVGAVQKIYSSQGIYGFFKGFVPRGTRVMSAVTIMGYVGEQMQSVLQREEQSRENQGSSQKKM